MGRNGRTPVKSGTGGQPKWTDEQRHVLDLTYRLWQLNHQQANALFHRVYPNMPKDKRDYKYDHTRDEWKHRFKEGRSKKWWYISRPNKFNRVQYTQEENDERYRIMLVIRGVAAAGPGRDEIPLVLKEKAPVPVPSDEYDAASAATVDGGTIEEDGEENLKDGEGDQEEDGGDQGAGEEDGETGQGDFDVPEVIEQTTTAAARQSRRCTRSHPRLSDDHADNIIETSEPAPKRRKTVAGKSVPKSTSSTPNTAPTSTIPAPSTAADPRLYDPNEQQLTMVHFTYLDWNASGRLYFNPPDGSADFIPPTDKKFYAMGGPIHYVSFGAYSHHVMVCNADVCSKCSTRPIPTNAGDYRGKPFVHTGPGRDVESYDAVRNVYVVKNQGIRLYDNEVHEHFKPAMIRCSGSSGVFERSAWVCDAQNCPTCLTYPAGLDSAGVAAEMGKIQGGKIKPHRKKD